MRRQCGVLTPTPGGSCPVQLPSTHSVEPHATARPALMQVILALTEKFRDHIPYRSSKLTHMLRDSLGGNCKCACALTKPQRETPRVRSRSGRTGLPWRKRLAVVSITPLRCLCVSRLTPLRPPLLPRRTLMIANVWAAPEHLDETISTCKFAARIMRITNAVSVNLREARADTQTRTRRANACERVAARHPATLHHLFRTCVLPDRHSMAYPTHSAILPCRTLRQCCGATRERSGS